MIGAKSYEAFDASALIEGMGSSQYVMDRGYAPSGTVAGVTTYSTLNPIAAPGILYPIPPLTADVSGVSLTGLLIAAACDPNVTGYERLYVSDDAKFYSLVTNTLTLRHTDATGSRQYTPGKTDMVVLGFSVFTTSSSTNTGISRWQPSSNTFTDNFFAFSDVVAPHPALLYENNAFYGDGNLLLRQTAEGSTPTTILTLDDAYVIQALGIDPGTGRMLISVTLGINYSDSQNQPARVLYYDGFSNKVSRVVEVDDMVMSFHPCGGTVFIGYGNKFGYWNGSGIEYLRTLVLPIGVSGSRLPYKFHITNIDKTLYIVEDTRVLAYGEIQPGKRVFYYAMRSGFGDAGNYSIVDNVGSGKLLLSFSPHLAYTFDMTDVTNTLSSQGTTYIWSNRKEFDRPVTFNQIVIELLAGATASKNIVDVELLDDKGNFTLLGRVSTPSANDPLTYELPWPSIETRSLQFRLTFISNGVTGTAGIRRATVFFNPKD